MKNILVQFDIQVGEYEHSEHYLFNKKMSEWEYCKAFWSIDKKVELDNNVFWDNYMMNAISVYSETELTDQQAKTLKEVGVVF
tara:strand:- start:63 stop:311 length:249 start_codon:yes stop_codon:yes gene_type:complete